MPLSLVLNLLLVYLVWGTTFLAMRITVLEGSGFAPFSVVAWRMLAASIVLLAWARFRNHSLSISRRQVGILTLSGSLIWLGANGLTTWAEQWVESSFAAMIFGGMPLWTATIDSIWNRQRPPASLILSLAIGIAGMVVLFLGALETLTSEAFFPTFLIFVGTVAWAFSVNFKKRNPTPHSVTVSSGYQQLFSAVVLFAVSLSLGEPFPDPTPLSWAAWGYLVVFGSILAFSAYNAVLEKVSPNVTMTFSFVCPVIGIVAGWAALGEPITNSKIAGAALILLGVAGIFRTQKNTKKP